MCTFVKDGGDIDGRGPMNSFNRTLLLATICTDKQTTNRQKDFYQNTKL